MELRLKRGLEVHHITREVDLAMVLKKISSPYVGAPFAGLWSCGSSPERSCPAQANARRRLQSLNSTWVVLLPYDLFRPEGIQLE
jgi:hypothetical protein